MSNARKRKAPDSKSGLSGVRGERSLSTLEGRLPSHQNSLSRRLSISGPQFSSTRGLLTLATFLAVFVAFADLLVQVKPLLHSSSNPPTLLPLLRSLYSQASDLSATLSTGKDTLEEKEADELDSEGVGIWNLSGEWKEKGLENVWAWGTSAIPHSSEKAFSLLMKVWSYPCWRTYSQGWGICVDRERERAAFLGRRCVFFLLRFADQHSAC